MKTATTYRIYIKNRFFPVCLTKSSLKPKDAKPILMKHVLRDLPRPWVSETLCIAKKIAKSGIASSEVFLSKLEGHADLLRKLGHHCRVEVTDYQGMVQVRKKY